MIHCLYYITIDNTAKNCKLQKFATTINNFGKINYFRHASWYIVHIYIYINFQHNRVGRSVKTVHINLFAKNRKLHKFTTTNLVIFKESIMPDMHRRKLYMYINFQQNRVSGSVKTVHIIYLQKHHKLHKFATTNSNF